MCDVSSVTSRIKKIHIQILGSANCKKSITDSASACVKNHNHPFSKVFEPQPVGSPT